MSRLDMVRVVIAELGEAAAAGEVVQFVADRFRAEIGVKFVPIYRAALRAEVELKRARERATGVADAVRPAASANP